MPSIVGPAEANGRIPSVRVIDPGKGPQTSPQVSGGRMVSGGRLAPQSTGKHLQKIRQMRKDPTIALARLAFAAPILMSEWALDVTDDAPEGARELIDQTFVRRRSRILEAAVYGCMDFGWQGFEKVFEPLESGELDCKLKPLLHDYTEILASDETGEFLGLMNYSMTSAAAGQVGLDTRKSLLIAWDIEGTDWYGQSTTDRAELPYDNWLTVQEAADRFDRKIAGSHWVIHYPIGTSQVGTEEEDNYDVALRILGSLQAAGGCVVPSDVAAQVRDLDAERPGWKIELLANPNTVAPFTERQKYLDTLKVRAYGLPERMLLEGEHGTKAEAGEHANIAIVGMELRHQVTCDAINRHAVDQVLRINFSKETEGTVQIVPAAIDERQRAFVRQIYQQILSSPDGAITEIPELDMQAIRDELELPTLTEE